MIVEPAPASPRSPVTRGLRVLAMLVPVVLLAGVVAAGVLGPRDPERSSDASPIAVTPSGAASPGASGGLVADAGADAGFPETWIGFRVWSVAQAQAERAAGRARDLVAVAGYLQYGSLPWTCVDAYLDVERAACQGRATLADARAEAGGTDAGATGSAIGGAAGPHLHPTFPPGTRGPAPDEASDGPRAEPIPVVVLGSFDDPRGLPCSGGGLRCDEAFVVERVVWVAGAPWGPMLTVDPAMGVEPNIPEIQVSVKAAETALGKGSLALATAVVRPGALPVIDPAAAAAIEPLPAGMLVRPVTYVRGLVFQFDASQPLYGRDPRVGWVVLNSITGEVMARGGAALGPTAVLALTP